MATVLAFATLLAGSALVFGFTSARESHGQAQDEPARHSGQEETVEPDQRGTGELLGAILLGLAAASLSPLTAALQSRGDTAAATRASASLGATLDSGLGASLATLSTGAATVHFAVVAQHLDEWWLAGTFFIVVGLFQLVWAPLVLLRPSLPLYLSGAVVNAGALLAWLVSRTTGVPIGPEAGQAEPIGFPDGLATGYEALIVLVVATLLSPWGRRHGTWPPGGMGGRTASYAIVAALTAFALIVLS